MTRSYSALNRSGETAPRSRVGLIEWLGDTLVDLGLLDLIDEFRNFGVLQCLFPKQVSAIRQVRSKCLCLWGLLFKWLDIHHPKSQLAHWLVRWEPGMLS